MGDWTTKVIREGLEPTEIDLPPDLDSFPAVLKGSNMNEYTLILLSKDETRKLYEILKEYYETSENI